MQEELVPTVSGSIEPESPVKKPQPPKLERQSQTEARPPAPITEVDNTELYLLGAAIGAAFLLGLFTGRTFSNVVSEG